MTMEKMKPAAEFSLRPKESREYHGIRICLGINGRLRADGSVGSEVVSFTRHQGMSSLRCIAALSHGTVYVFEGPAIGPSMIDEQRVRSALGM